MRLCVGTHVQRTNYLYANAVLFSSSRDELSTATLQIYTCTPPVYYYYNYCTSLHGAEQNVNKSQILAGCMYALRHRSMDFYERIYTRFVRTVRIRVPRTPIYTRINIMFLQLQHHAGSWYSHPFVTRVRLYPPVLCTDDHC